MTCKFEIISIRIAFPLRADRAGKGLTHSSQLFITQKRYHREDFLDKDFFVFSSLYKLYQTYATFYITNMIIHIKKHPTIM